MASSSGMRSSKGQWLGTGVVTPKPTPVGELALPQRVPAGLAGVGLAGNSQGPQHWGQAQRAVSNWASVSLPVKGGVSTTQTTGHHPDTPSAPT